MYEHLGVSLHPFVEFLIGHLSVIDADLVTDDKARFRFACNDQVPQVSIILLDIALSSCQ